MAAIEVQTQGAQQQHQTAATASSDRCTADHHIGIWRALLQKSAALFAEMSVGPLLLGTEARLLPSLAPHVVPFFHRHSVLPVAAVIGCRSGVFIFAMMICAYMLHNIRRHGWKFYESSEAFEECMKPALAAGRCFLMVQNGLAIAFCAAALWSHWCNPRGLPLQALWPVLGVASTAMVMLAVEMVRIGHWREVLRRLHALDLAKRPKPKFTLKVPAKLRPLRPEEEDDCCCICLQPYERGETLAELKCKHSFHEACIKTWLVQSDLCPMRCNTGSVRCCVPSAGHRFKIGQKVEVRCAVDEPWRRGTVACESPLLVRPFGWLHSHPWEITRPLPREDEGEGRPGAAAEHEHQD